MKTLSLRRHHPAPTFALTDASGNAVGLRDYCFRKDLLLFCLHGPHCPECARIVQKMTEQRDDWESWGTTLLLLHAENEPFSAPFRQAQDAGSAVRRRYGGPEADAVIAVIEHRGRLMDGWTLAHPDPADWHEVAETVRWVAVQEPECGACEVLPGWDED